MSAPAEKSGGKHKAKSGVGVGAFATASNWREHGGAARDANKAAGSGRGRNRTYLLTHLLHPTLAQRLSLTWLPGPPNKRAYAAYLQPAWRKSSVDWLQIIESHLALSNLLLLFTATLNQEAHYRRRVPRQQHACQQT